MGRHKTDKSSELERVAVTIEWQDGKKPAPSGGYSLEHQWHIDGRTLTVTDGPPPEGYRHMVRLDPLQAYVATISSSHMYEWLQTVFGLGVDVASYRDSAQGVLSALPEGEGSWVSEVVLRPQVRFGPKRGMTEEAIARVHEMALGGYVARSIKTKIRIASA